MRAQSFATHFITWSLTSLSTCAISRMDRISSSSSEGSRPPNARSMCIIHGHFCFHAACSAEAHHVLQRLEQLRRSDYQAHICARNLILRGSRISQSAHLDIVVARNRNRADNRRVIHAGLVTTTNLPRPRRVVRTRCERVRSAHGMPLSRETTQRRMRCQRSAGVSL